MRLGASDFAIFTRVGAIERTKLIPILDSSFPDIGDLARAIAGTQGQPLRQHVLVSALPCRWRCATNDRAEPSPAICTEIDPVASDRDGLGFPVFAENGRAGIVVMLGHGLAPDNGAVCEAHLDCMAIFSAIERLRTTSDGTSSTITRRELECLRLTARGMTSEEIAAVLRMSAHTANQHLSNAIQKLDAVNRMHGVAKAMRLGLLD